MIAVATAGRYAAEWFFFGGFGAGFGMGATWMYYELKGRRHRRRGRPCEG